MLFKVNRLQLKYLTCNKINCEHESTLWSSYHAEMCLCEYQFLVQSLLVSCSHSFLHHGYHTG